MFSSRLPRDVACFICNARPLTGLEQSDLADGFRADNGFVPQVGYRQAFFDTGYTMRPKKGALHRIRTFFIAERQEDRAGGLLYSQVSPGFGMSGKRNYFGRFRVAFDEIRAVGEITTEAGTEEVRGTFDRTQFIYTVDFSPSRRFSRLRLNGRVGDEVDWLRLIGQYVDTERDPGLYSDPEGTDDRSCFFSGSAVFAYKLNWQTVLFLGYGDNRELDDRDQLEPAGRQLFLKVSYAFQR